MRRCLHCEKRIWFWYHLFNHNDLLTNRLYYHYDIDKTFLHRKCWQSLEARRIKRLEKLKEWQKYHLEMQQHKGHGYARCSVKGCRWHEYDDRRQLDMYKADPK